MRIRGIIMVSFFCFLAFSSPGQDTSSVIPALDKDLTSGKITISDVLTDQKLMYLHSLTSFREIIKKHASAATVTVVTNSEPGVRITVNGTVTNKAGKPLANVLLYFYHTSDKGWYSDTAAHIRKDEGDHRHSRLFGYVKTNSAGRFTLHTIRPNGYPGSDFAGHIHIQLWKEDGTFLAGIPGELQFDDDIRMTDQRRRQSISAGFLVAKNEGTKELPVYNFTIPTKVN